MPAEMPVDMPAALPEAPLAETPSEVDGLLERAHRIRHDDTRSALALCAVALDISLRIDYQRGIGYSLLRGSLCHFILQDGDDDHLAMLQRAIALLRGLGDQRGEAEALNLLGNIEAGSLNNIALVYRDLAQPAEALKYLFMGQEVAEASGDARSVAYAMANIGAVLGDLGDRAHAVDYLQRALALAAHTDDRALESSTLTSLGRLLVAMGQVEEAEARLDRALALAHRTGNLEDKSEAMLGQALVRQARGEHERADHLLRECLALVRRAGDRAREAAILLALGDSRWRQGDTATAVKLLDGALALADDLAAHHLAGQIHELLADVHEAESRHPQALAHLRCHLACQRRLSGQDTQRRIRALLARTELERAQRETEAQRQINATLSSELALSRAEERRKDDLLAQLNEQSRLLQQLAREDGLTAIANRRWLDVQYGRELQRARRYGHALTFVMIDVDHFKRVNDVYSHPVGDEVLRVIARLLRDGVRASDLAARYGGEEFALLLVETPLANALVICEKLRRQIEDYPWHHLHPGLSGVTISLGAAGVTVGPHTGDLARAADVQLLRAKREGRNRVCHAA